MNSQSVPKLYKSFLNFKLKKNRLTKVVKHIEAWKEIYELHNNILNNNECRDIIQENINYENDELDKRLDYVLKVLDLSKFKNIFIQNNITFKDFIMLSINDLNQMRISFVARNRILNFSKAYMRIAKEYNIYEIISFFDKNKCFVIKNNEKEDEIVNVVSTAEFNKNSNENNEEIKNINFNSKCEIRNIRYNLKIQNDKLKYNKSNKSDSSQIVNNLNNNQIKKNKKSLSSTSCIINEHLKLKKNIDRYFENYRKEKKSKLDYDIKSLISIDNKSVLSNRNNSRK